MRVLNIALGFSFGMLTAILGPLLVVPAIGAAGLFVGGSVLRLCAALGIPAVVGGALAGWSLRRGWRGTLAFAGAFPIGLSIAFFAVTTLGALSGHETPTQLVAVYVGIFFVAYALLGVVGASIAGLDWRLASRVLLAFGASGAVGGLVLASVAIALAQDVAADASLRVVGSALALLIPATACGWFLGRILLQAQPDPSQEEDPSRRQ